MIGRRVPSRHRPVGRGATVAVAVLIGLVGCGAPSPTPSIPASPSPSIPVPSASAIPSAGAVVPAPGSDSAVYAPNPAAIVVAIDPGHGGCLDWGVPDPSRRGVEFSEKAMTLGIARDVQGLLEAQGITVVMMRTDDSALAGDNDPEFGCNGPAWRDVNGDGRAGFEATGRVRTRDELQARIDRANLARADAFVSIHINSLTQNGVSYEIAATQSYYDDESPWGVAGSAVLAGDVQTDVVAALDPLASYQRQDRGTEAVAYYVISRAWRDGDTCEVPGDTWCKPHRALQMPGTLSEVGSISLRAEQDLLSTAAGQAAAARGVYDGLAAYLGTRPQAVRYDVAGATEPLAQSTGPLASAPLLPGSDLSLTLTNRGTAPWPAGLRLVAGWQASELPYLPSAPAATAPLDAEVPALGPGESVTLRLAVPPFDGPGRGIWWASLDGPAGSYADLGSPPVQLANVKPSSG